MGKPPFNLYQHNWKVCKYLQLNASYIRVTFTCKVNPVFHNGPYKLVNIWMIIQWARSYWHKESFRVRTTNTIINILEKNYIEFWLFFLTYSISWHLSKDLIYYQMKAYSERYYIIKNRNSEKMMEVNKCKRLLGIKIDNKL